MEEKRIDINSSLKHSKGPNNESSGFIFSSIDDWLAEHSTVQMKDKVVFFRLLSTMINAGITLTEGIEILREQTTSPKLKIVLKKIRNRLSSGSSLSKGMNLYPDVFSTAEVGVIKAGEESGNLDTVLKDLSDQVESSYKLSAKIKGALMYPIVILIIVAGALSAIMVFVIPQIAEMFDSLGVELPIATVFLIESSNFLTSSGFGGINNGIILLFYIFIFSTVFHSFKKTRYGGIFLGILMLKIPIFGDLVQKMAVAKFCRGLSILLGSGLTLLDALFLVSNMIGSEAYKVRILKIIKDVKQGLTISQNIKHDVLYFPPILPSMISVGEKAADLEGITKKIAGFYEEEVDTMAKNLSALLEPIIIVIVGGVVGGVIIAVMLPILSVSDLATAG